MSDDRKALRGYLKAYRVCQDQALEIAKQIKHGEVLDAVKDILLNAKNEFEIHCRNVHLILSYLPQESTVYRVMSLRYLRGMSIKEISDQLKYSVGYCQNVEAEAIEYLSGRSQVMKLIAEKNTT